MGIHMRDTLGSLLFSSFYMCSHSKEKSDWLKGFSTMAIIRTLRNPLHKYPLTRYDMATHSGKTDFNTVAGLWPPVLHDNFG